MVDIDLIIDGAQAEQLYLAPGDEFATEIEGRRVVLEMDEMGSELSTVLDELCDYKQELVNKHDRAKSFEIVDGKEWDMVDLAHLSGKISGLDAGIAAIEEVIEC